MKVNIKKDTSVIEFLETRKDFEKYGLKKTFHIKARFTKKNLDEKKRIITGYASVAEKDRDGDIITMEALKKAQDDLLQPGSNTVFLNHDREMAIGRTLETAVDGSGLIVKVLISSAEDCKDVWTKIKEKILNSFSIGGRFKKVQVERDEEGRVIGFKVLEIELFEVSVVGIPANAKASIFAVMEKAFKGFVDSEREQEMTKEEKEAKEKEEKAAKELTEKTAKENAAKVITEDKVKEMINEAIAPISKGFADLSANITKLLEKKPEDKKEETKKTDDGIPAWATTLQTEMKSLSEKMTKEPSRKGIVNDEDEEEEEGEEETDVAPEKCLDPDNEKCLPYLKHVMADIDEFKKMPEKDQKIAKTLWFRLMQSAISKKD